MGFYVFPSCYCCVCPKSNATLLRAFYFAFSIASLRGTSTIFFRHFPEIFFSPRIWLFWFAAPLCGRAKPFQFDYFLFFPFSIFSFRHILCSFWFVSIRFFLYKIRYLCKCLPAVRCLCFCGASIRVVFSFYVFYFEGKSLKRRQAADILRICQVKVRVVCLCFYLHFTILLLALPISKRRKIFHSFVAYFSVCECCFLIYL